MTLFRRERALSAEDVCAAGAAFFPEPDAAAHSEFVGDEFDVVGEMEFDGAGVATADVEAGEVGEDAEGFDGFLDAAVPAAFADFFEGGVAELLFVGLAFAEGVVGKFEVGGEASVFGEAGAEASAEGDDHFDAPAGDGAEALDVGVVEDADGFAEFAGEGEVEIKAEPCALAEVVCGEDFATADEAGEADGDAVVAGEWGDEFCEGGDHFRGAALGRGGDAKAFGDHFSSGVEEGGFEAGAADVYGEGDGAGCGVRCSRG